MCIWALVLDDDKSRHNSYRDRFGDSAKKIISDHCMTASDCIAALSKRIYDIILLDHDLSEEFDQDISGNNTGSEVARWIAEDQIRIGNAKVFVHSLSDEGSANMIRLIPRAKHVKWAWMKDTFDTLEI